MLPAPRHPRALWLPLLLLVTAAVSGCTPARYPTVASAFPADEDYESVAASARALAQIDPAVAVPRYSRDAFGEAWSDIDGNGCSQRQDVLARDLVEIVVASDGCTILRGRLAPDAYTGATVDFQHDRIAPAGAVGSRAVQIDHIVSLSAAYTGGAWRWSENDRVRFANDLSNLLAVDGTANESKSNLGPARWLPANPDFVCTYVAAYTRVATEWDLAVSRDDRDRLVTTLDSCARAER